MSTNKPLVATYYIAFGLLLFVLALFRPHLNWDVLGYTAAVKAYDTDDATTIHAFAYGELERVAPPETLAELAPPDTSSYRGAVRADPNAFVEQLTYYRARVGYVALVRLLYALGTNIVFATYLVSAISVCLGIGVLLLVVQREIRAPFVYVVPLFALIFGTLELAKSSSPDGLAFLGVILAAFLFLRGNPLVFAVLPALITVRADLVLFCIPLLLYIGIVRKRPAASLLSALAIIGVYVWIGQIYEHPRWATIIYAANFGGTPFPLTDPPEFSARTYFTLLAKGLYAMSINQPFLVVTAAVWFAIFGVPILKRAPTDRVLLPRGDLEALLCCSVVYGVGHFLLLPLLWERYFTAHYLLATVSLLAKWSRLPQAHGTETFERP